MNLSVDALVLRCQNLKESDRLCLLLTDTLGPVRAFVRGARNLKNKNFSATSQFACGRFTLYYGKDRYIIDETNLERVYSPLPGDLDRLSLAQYLCELSGELAPPDRNSADFLRLMRGALGLLASDKRSCAVVKAASELRMLTLAGYMPDLVMCSGCGAYQTDPMYFHPATGTLRCAECGAADGSLALAPGALTAMRHCVYAEANRLFSFELAEPSRSQLERASESYLTLRLERGFTTLDFYRSLRDNAPPFSGVPSGAVDYTDDDDTGNT